ncbi:MAG: hypothetical protein WBA87_02695 [Microbacterium sp.]
MRVNAEVVQAALGNILDGLMDRGVMPAVRLSNAKTRVVRLMNQIDEQGTDREDGSKR